MMMLGQEDDFSPFYASVKCPANTYVGKCKASSGNIVFQTISFRMRYLRHFFSGGGRGLVGFKPHTILILCAIGMSHHITRSSYSVRCFPYAVPLEIRLCFVSDLLPGRTPRVCSEGCRV